MKIGNINISSSGITWSKKALGSAVAYAVNQGAIMYQIGDNPRNYIKDGYLQNPNVYSLMTLMVGAFIKGHIELFDITNKENPVEIKDHDILDLLARPNPLMGRKDFFEAYYVSRNVTGEVFILKNRVPIGKDSGKVLQLMVLPSQYMDIKQGLDGMPIKYRYSPGLNQEVEFNPADIIYIKTFNPNAGIRGVSPLCAGREILAHDNDIITANRKLTANMGPTGILTLGEPGVTDFNQVQLDQFKAKYRQAYQGKNNYGDIHITGEKTSWVTTGSTADDLGIFEASKMTMRELCNIYGVSSQLLNDPENKTYNNMNDARKSLISNVAIPQWHLFLSALNIGLVSEYEKRDNKKYELKLNKQGYEELRDEELAHVQAASQAWWLSVNEKRKILGYPPLSIPEGDDIYVPINAMPISTNSDSASKLRNAYAQASQIEAPKPETTNQ